jgi:hypothetical protein
MYSEAIAQFAAEGSAAEIIAKIMDFSVTGRSAEN